MSSGVSPGRAQTEAAASANDSVSGIPGGDPASVPGTPLVRALNGLRIASAADLGARIVLQDEGSAILVDPTGAPFGIQVWDDGGDSAQQSGL